MPHVLIKVVSSFVEEDRMPNTPIVSMKPLEMYSELDELLCMLTASMYYTHA